MSSHRTRLSLIVGIGVVLGGAGAAMADEVQVCPLCGRIRNESVTYQTKAGHTLVRGAANALFGWTELIREPATEVRRGGNVFTGIAKGVGGGVQRTLGGVAEVLTFWTPKVQHHYLRFSNDCPLCMGQPQPQAPPPPPQQSQPR